MYMYIDFLVMLLVFNKMRVPVQLLKDDAVLCFYFHGYALILKGTFINTGRLHNQGEMMHSFTLKKTFRESILTYCKSVLITSINNRPRDSIPNIIFPQCYNLKQKCKY